MKTGLFRGTLAAVVCLGCVAAVADDETAAYFAGTDLAAEREVRLPDPGAAPPVPASFDRTKQTLVEANSTRLEVQSTPTARPKPAPKPWKGLFYNNDFSYLCEDDFCPLIGDRLKNICIGECGVLSYGGELRARYMDDRNRFRTNYPARNDYTLIRWRQYLD